MLAVLVAVVAIFMAWAAKNRLRATESRLTTIEEQLARLRGAAELRAVSTLAEAKPAPGRGRVAPPEPVSPPPQPEPEAMHAAEPPPPPPPSPPPQPQEPERSFEERFGTQWVVWVGGVALALGGIFLVRYTIEQGLFRPGLRVIAGAVLALALVG